MTVSFIRRPSAAVPMGDETIRYRCEGPAAVVTLDRPDKLNAVDPGMADALADAVDRFVGDDEARVLVLTGAGDAFSSGADLLAWRDVLEDGTWQDHVGDGGPLGFTRRTDVRKPSIAAIDGPCIAGGMEIAAWCDLRVAGTGSTFAFGNRRWNVPLIDGGTQRLPRICGLGRALDLILTGRTVDAREAEHLGFVNRVVPEGRALEAAVEIAGTIAGFPRDALLGDRKATLEGIGMSLEWGLSMEAETGEMFADGAARERTIERLDAFAEGER